MNKSEKSTYLTQVKKQHLIAHEALTHYPLKIKEIELKRYAANTTFKVTDSRNKHYQLRIHPKEWYTKVVILEEIKWLKHILKTTNIVVPKQPIRAKNDQYVIKCQSQSESSSRYSELFEWLPGKKRWRSINMQYAFDLGALIGELHKNGQSIKIKERYCWNAESLVGTSKAKYYNVDKLSDINKNQQSLISQARNAVYDQLKRYEKTYKNKSGLIHGDTQPNNILYHHGKIAIIDFDDFDDFDVGLYIYDLATALHAFHQLTKGNKSKKYEELEEALFEGYSKHMPLEKEDIQLVPFCMLGVRVVTLGWLERHKDNLRLRQYYGQAITEVIHHFKKLN